LVGVFLTGTFLFGAFLAEDLASHQPPTCHRHWTMKTFSAGVSLARVVLIEAFMAGTFLLTATLVYRLVSTYETASSFFLIRSDLLGLFGLWSHGDIEDLGCAREAETD